MASPSGKAEACKASIPSSNLGATFFKENLMLYLISTPIGNLSDISFRAISTLKEVDYILAEDTRLSLKLLDRYEIKKKIFSFHKFKEKSEERRIIEDLQNGKNIALISDAGTPLISDPGESLVKKCQDENIPYTHIPGACSVINSLVLSGYKTAPFQFLGFLEKKESALKKQLTQMLFFQGTSLAFETPHHIINPLTLFQIVAPDCKIIITREMTKKFEEIINGTAAELITHFTKKEPKGEMVFVIERKDLFSSPDIALNELLEILQQNFSLPFKEALKMAAKILKTKKSELYKKTL